jgi:hypothetical protein
MMNDNKKKNLLNTSQSFIEENHQQNFLEALESLFKDKILGKNNIEGDIND